MAATSGAGGVGQVEHDGGVGGLEADGARRRVDERREAIRHDAVPWRDQRHQNTSLNYGRGGGTLRENGLNSGFNLWNLTFFLDFLI